MFPTTAATKGGLNRTARVWSEGEKNKGTRLLVLQQCPSLELISKLLKLLEGGSKVLEEDILVLSVLVDNGLERLVVNKGEIGRKHHESTGGLVLELLVSSRGLTGLPLSLEKLEEFVVEDKRLRGPSTLETGTVSVAMSDSVGSGEGNNVAVVESHAVEDITKVLKERERREKQEREKTRGLGRS